MINIIALILIIAVSGGTHENGYKGEFKEDTVIIQSLFDCEEFILHKTAGDDSYGENLALAGHLDIFKKGDTFIVIERVRDYIRLVAYHEQADGKGFRFEGWILDEWLWDAEQLPREGKLPPGREAKKPAGKKSI